MGFMDLFGHKKNGGSPPTFPPNPAPAAANSPSKVTLKKAQDGLDRYIVRLKKENNVDLSQHRARVFVAIDRSGSMDTLYYNGSVQEVLTRLLPLALKFDDNGELEVFVFNTKSLQLAPMTLDNYDGYVNCEILKKGYKPVGGTRYSPVINETTCRYDDGSSYPAFGIFITDGENSDYEFSDSAIRKSSEFKIFYQFVGIGHESFIYLKHLDDLDGRKVDNTAFVKVADFAQLDDDQLFNKLLEQYPQWLQAMHLN